MNNQLIKKESDTKKMTLEVNSMNSSHNSLFYNPNSNQKNSSYESYINVIKSDICAVQDLINKDSHILNFVVFGLPSTLKKRVKDLEEGKKEGVKLSLEKITSQATDMKYLQTTYKNIIKS